MSSRKGAAAAGWSDADSQAAGRSGRPDVSGLSYEQARDALADVVRRLESGAETLEESLALWERGEALAQRCQEWLDGAQARIDQARAGAAPAHQEADTSGQAPERDERQPADEIPRL